jgi:CBS domain-containing protein
MTSNMDSEIGDCTVGEVMGTELFTLTTDTAVASARRLVTEVGINHLLVLENGTLAGIVCGEDLRGADRDAVVGDLMSSPVLCITPDTTLQEAVDIMGENDLDCLPVVTGSFLIGMVTRAALAIARLSPSSETGNRICEACASTGDVTPRGATTGIALCLRCRKVIAANQCC